MINQKFLPFFPSRQSPLHSLRHSYLSVFPSSILLARNFFLDLHTERLYQRYTRFVYTFSELILIAVILQRLSPSFLIWKCRNVIRFVKPRINIGCAGASLKVLGDGNVIQKSSQPQTQEHRGGATLAEIRTIE